MEIQVTKCQKCVSSLFCFQVMSPAVQKNTALRNTWLSQSIVNVKLRGSSQTEGNKGRVSNSSHGSLLPEFTPVCSVTAALIVTICCIQWLLRVNSTDPASVPIQSVLRQTGAVINIQTKTPQSCCGCAVS